MGTASRALVKGELVNIIIGTVANAEQYLGHDRGITTKELTGLLHRWGVAITENHARSRLNALANRGRIERVGAGLFRRY